MKFENFEFVSRIKDSKLPSSDYKIQNEPIAKFLHFSLAKTMKESILCGMATCDEIQ